MESGVRLLHQPGADACAHERASVWCVERAGETKARLPPAAGSWQLAAAWGRGRWGAGAREVAGVLGHARGWGGRRVGRATVQLVQAGFCFRPPGGVFEAPGGALLSGGPGGPPHKQQERQERQVSINGKKDRARYIQRIVRGKAFSKDRWGQFIGVSVAGIYR